MDKLVLIDGNSLINRAFYAIGPLTDKNGQPTNAVYGFTNMLIKIISEVKPKYMLVAFDVHAKTFRHKLYTEYKGTRKPMPEDLRPQIPLLKKVLQTMGIKTFELAGFEADDIIGTLAKRYKGETIIYTGDKDSFQLVDETTSIYFTKRGITDVDVYNNENFLSKTGINPSQVIDLKSLMGDSSDNIPGVAGVGEKTALNLIQNYNSLDGVYENLSKITGKLNEKLSINKETAYLSKTLATINTLVEIPLNIEEARYNFPFSQDVFKLFIELDFKNMLKRAELFDAIEPEEENDDINVETITNKEELQKIINSNEVSLVIGENISLYTLKDTEYTVKIKETFFDEGFDFDEALTIIKPFFEDEDKTVIAYSRKKLFDALKELKINLKAKVKDVDILRYILDFSGKEDSVKDVLQTYGLSVKTPAFSLYKLNKKFELQLKEQGLEKLYYDVELPLSTVLTDMETYGFRVDIEALNQIGEEYKKEIESLTQKIN